MPKIGRRSTSWGNVPLRTWKIKYPSARKEKTVRTIPITFKLLVGAGAGTGESSVSPGSGTGNTEASGMIGGAGSVGTGGWAGPAGCGIAAGSEGTGAGSGSNQSFIRSGISSEGISSALGVIMCPHQGHSIVSGVNSAVQAGHWILVSSLIINSFACPGSVTNQGKAENKRSSD